MSEVTTWIALAAMTVSAAGVAINGWFTYLASRDKLSYDAKLVILTAEVLECKKDRDRLHDDLEILRSEVKELRDRLYGGAK